MCVEIREPLQLDLGRNSATLGLIRGREALFMKQNFIQNMLKSTVFPLPFYGLK